MVCSKQPSLMLDILDTADSGGPEQPGSEGRAVPSWCICTYCRDMPTDREKLCCGKSRLNCQSRLPVSIQLSENSCMNTTKPIVCLHLNFQDSCFKTTHGNPQIKYITKPKVVCI
jgi:hypothetical protein